MLLSLGLLELQSGGAGPFRDFLDPSVILVPAAVEDHGLDALTFGSLADELADLTRGGLGLRAAFELPLRLAFWGTAVAGTFTVAMQGLQVPVLGQPTPASRTMSASFHVRDLNTRPVEYRQPVWQGYRAAYGHLKGH